MSGKQEQGKKAGRGPDSAKGRACELGQAPDKIHGASDHPGQRIENEQGSY